jgi:hypothetical protein
MKRILFLVLFSPIILSAQISEKKPEVVFDQLLGTWQFGSNSEYESWTKDKHVYYGTVFSVTNGDTTISEKCRIYKSKGKYYFEQKVVLSSILSTSVYTLEKLDQKVMEFQNMTLTFPQKIGYEWLPENKLAVVQEGLVAGRTESLKFSYSKIK